MNELEALLKALIDPWWRAIGREHDQRNEHEAHGQRNEILAGKHSQEQTAERIHRADCTLDRMAGMNRIGDLESRILKVRFY